MNEAAFRMMETAIFSQNSLPSHFPKYWAFRLFSSFSAAFSCFFSRFRGRLPRHRHFTQESSSLHPLQWARFRFRQHLATLHSPSRGFPGPSWHPGHESSALCGQAPHSLPQYDSAMATPAPFS